MTVHVPVKVWFDLNHNEGKPKYETLGAAGMDVRANEEVSIAPGATVLIPTGIYMAIPGGFEVQVRPRSGLSLKTKFRIANSPATIDSDYRGELMLIAQNTGSLDYLNYKIGERLAQIVLCPVYQIVWDEVMSKEDLPSTDRGEGGFGSTGTA